MSSASAALGLSGDRRVAQHRGVDAFGPRPSWLSLSNFADWFEVASALPKERRGPILARWLTFFFMVADFMLSSDLPMLSFFMASDFMAPPDLAIPSFFMASDFMASDFMASDFMASPDLPILSCACAAP